MEEVSFLRHSKKVRTLADLPDSIRAENLFYNEINHPEIFIQPHLRDKICAVRTLEGDPEKHVIYIVRFTNGDAESQDRIRNIVQAYKKNPAKYKISVKIADATNSEIITTINKVVQSTQQKRNTVKASKSTQDGTVLAEDILTQAMRAGASDLHVESDGKKAVVRFRVNKELYDYTFLSHEDADKFASVCYGTFVIGEGEDQETGTGKGVYRSSNLLEGEFSRRIEDINMKARMVNIGHNHGDSFDFTSRLIDLNKNAKAKTFDELAFSKNSCRLLRVTETLSRGMILTIGVTGSGKSTSQQNMMQQERDRSGGSKKIISIEHPVEYNMDRITQISAGEEHESPDRNFSFDHINTLLMRADPDTIAYGEIRNSETAKASIKGVESGHLVYGTMHASDAMGAFSRFGSFGIKMETVCKKGFLRLILYQMLLPKLCPDCSIKYKIGSDIPDKYGEVFALKSHKLPNGQSISLKEIIEAQDDIGPHDSLIRDFQAQGKITTKDVIDMRRKLEVMNADNDKEGLKLRLQKVINISMLREDEINIRFRGTGCKNCFQGQVGVVPASEVIVPDETFLRLMREGQPDKAELYWKASLGGRSATSDSYEKILSGHVDPRTVEEELENLG